MRRWMGLAVGLSLVRGAGGVWAAEESVVAGEALATEAPATAQAGIAANVGAKVAPKATTTLRNPAVVKAQYEAIASRVDAGGDMLVIANVDGLVEQGVESLRAIFQATLAGQTNAAQVTAALDRLPAFLKKNGFYSVRGIGFSAVPRVDGLNDLKTFVSRDPASAELPMWRVFSGGKARRMACLDMIPADTAMLRTLNMEPAALWTLVKQGVSEVGGADAEAGFEKGLAAFEAMAGIPLETLMLSLGDEMFFSVQVPAGKSTAGAAGNPMMSLMSLSVFVGVSVKDDTLFNLIEAKAAESPMPLVKTNMGSAVVLKSAMPPGMMPVSPCFASVNGYVVFSLNEKTLNAALAAVQKKNGLVNTPRFKKAFEGMPMENNGLAYVAPRFMQKMLEVQAQALAMAPTGPGQPDFAAVQKLMMGETNQMAAMVVTTTPAGVLVSGVSSMGGREMVGVISMAPAGLLAAVAIPSFVKARNTSQENACMNNMRIIDAAKEQWAMANRKTDGDEVDIEGACQYIKGSTVPVCPAGGEYTFGAIGENPSCSHEGHYFPGTKPGPGVTPLKDVKSKPGAKPVGPAAQKSACINNLRIMDSAKEQWAMANRKTDGDEVDVEGACQYIKGSTVPVCPAGGTYTFGTIGEMPTCSESGHVMPE